MLPYIKQRPERKLYDKILYEQHVVRVKNMLPTIDNSPPRKHPYNHRYLQEHVRQMKKIERENCKILENIAIVVKKSTIDNSLSKHVQYYRTFNKRLHNIKRKNEMRKITNENLQLLRRIQQVPPTINM